jgi:hypothetical protein
MYFIAGGGITSVGAIMSVGRANPQNNFLWQA